MKNYLIFCLVLLLFVSMQVKGNSLVNVTFEKEVILSPESGFFVGGWGVGVASEPGVIVDGIFVPENYQWDQDGCVWWDQYDAFNVQQAIYINLGQIVKIEQLIGQFDNNDGYIVSYRNLANGQWELAWYIDSVVPNWGMLTRPVPYDGTQMYVLASPIITDALKIEGHLVNSDRLFSVSEFQAYGIPQCYIDIKPQSCPNPLNVKSNGVLPVAILGTEDFDVTTFDVATITLAGVSPLRSHLEDVTAPLDKKEECGCFSEGPDGFMDLSLKFDTQAIIGAIGDVEDGEMIILTLTGSLQDGTSIEGTDCVLIVKKNK